jgi:hypothetical protein
VGYSTAKKLLGQNMGDEEKADKLLSKLRQVCIRPTFCSTEPLEVSSVTLEKNTAPPTANQAIIGVETIPEAVPKVAMPAREYP